MRADNVRAVGIAGCQCCASNAAAATAAVCVYKVSLISNEYSRAPSASSSTLTSSSSSWSLLLCYRAYNPFGTSPPADATTHAAQQPHIIPHFRAAPRQTNKRKFFSLSYSVGAVVGRLRCCCWLAAVCIPEGLREISNNQDDLRTRILACTQNFSACRALQVRKACTFHLIPRYIANLVTRQARLQCAQVAFAACAALETRAWVHPGNGGVIFACSGRRTTLWYFGKPGNVIICHCNVPWMLDTFPWGWGVWGGQAKHTHKYGQRKFEIRRRRQQRRRQLFIVYSMAGAASPSDRPESVANK